MSSSEETSWVAWFCSLRGNEFFCEVDLDYIQDKFNLTGLETRVPKYKEALDMILDLENDEFLNNEDDNTGIIETAAESLYGLIHARFIMTKNGVKKMQEKFARGEFGHCPRVYCESAKMLPIGLSDIEGEAMVKMFCPKCDDIYEPKSTKNKHTDGAFFGTSFPQMLFMAYPDNRPPPAKTSWTPSLYGFVISKDAYQLQNRASEERQMKQKQREMLMGQQ